MDINHAYFLITQKLTNWVREFIRLLPNILLAAIIMVIGLFVAKWLKKITTKLLNRVSQNTSLHNLFASTVYIFFVSITVFTVLSVLKLDKAVTSILAGAGIIGLALAFAFQDIASNFISGIFISFRHPIRVGHIVKVKDFMGIVQDINLRDTIIRTFQGQTVIIPNKEVFQNPIENYSVLGKRRFDLCLSVARDQDLEKVKTVTLNALKEIDCLSKEDEATFFYDEVTGNNIKFTLRLWIATPEQELYLRAGSEAITRITKAYAENEIKTS